MDDNLNQSQQTPAQPTEPTVSGPVPPTPAGPVEPQPPVEPVINPTPVDQTPVGQTPDQSSQNPNPGGGVGI